MVTQPGFDDHAQEADAHPRLMEELSDAVAAFYQDMAAQGRAKQVLLMTFSRVWPAPLENASKGTDHGTAAPLLVVGGAVKGGLYGQDAQPVQPGRRQPALHHGLPLGLQHGAGQLDGRRPQPGGAGHLPLHSLRLGLATPPLRYTIW